VGPLTVLAALVAATAAAGVGASQPAQRQPGPALPAAGPARSRSDARARGPLPSVLHLVDRSRSIRLPGGRSVPRPVTTFLRYPPSGTGPWPLLVFGHGFAVTPAVYARLLRAWAAAGYLVAAPLFPLGNAHAPGGPDESDLVDQPADMSFVITQLLTASASAASPLHGLVDPSRIAVAGQSDGGVTAFAVAYERPYLDRRVDAAVILAGAELGHPRSRLRRPAVPLLAVQGTADRVNDPRNTEILYRAVTRPKFLLVLRKAGHLAPYTAPGRALAAVERVTTAFLNHYLGSGSLRDLSQAAHGAGIATLTSDP
jgi:predicted dienelactone hydrolase